MPYLATSSIECLLPPCLDPLAEQFIELCAQGCLDNVFRSVQVQLCQDALHAVRCLENCRLPQFLANPFDHASQVCAFARLQSALLLRDSSFCCDPPPALSFLGSTLAGNLLALLLKAPLELLEFQTLSHGGNLGARQLGLPSARCQGGTDLRIHQIVACHG